MDEIVVWLISIAKFGVMLGILIFVHELGHFLVARRFGVYIKKFFLGFDIGGLKLFSYKGRETEYGIGILPLGGYVKMAGQEDLPPGDEEAREKLENEDRDIPPERRFDRRPLPQRAAIVFAGPLMNLILGLVVFILVAMIGIEVPRYLSEPLVGLVEKGLPAEAAGVQPGDRILAVGGRKIEDWPALRWELRLVRSGEEVPITLEREGERLTVMVRPEIVRGTGYPRIGILPGGEAVVWAIQSVSPAAAAGLRVGDIIVSVDGVPLYCPFLDEIIGDQPAGTVAGLIRRPETGETLHLDLPTFSVSMIPGLYLDRDRVLNVDYQAEGEVGMMKKGDRIVAIDGEATAPSDVAGTINAARAGETLVLTVSRAGWMFFKPSSSFAVRAAVRPLTAVEGVHLNYPAETVLVRYSGLRAVAVGATNALESVEKMITVFTGMIVGQFGASEVSGPIGIFTITSQHHELAELLSLLALISINLGLINLFPLPVLDGGHLLFFLFEAIIRRPLPPRLLLVAQQIGLAMIAVLVVLITYKDILRVLGY
ncbi:MAG: RIP metalloprotease RseP [PVC group bacterium]